MLSKYIPVAALVLHATCFASPAEPNNRGPKTTCEATSNWPGFSKLQHIFSFGDSYTSTTFNNTGIQPTPTNPLGNPPFPGFTASNGPNWVDFLTVTYNQSLLLTYNLAFGGATIDSAIVAPFEPTVSSVAEQIENEWFPTYATPPSFAPWSSSDTLFTIFDGINDVGNSWFLNSTAINNEVFAVYHGLVDELYFAGARNFAFLNVPPVDRAPLTTQGDTPAEQAMEKADILDWNNRLVSMAKEVKSTFPDTNVFVFDTNTVFTEVLDNPSSFPQTALYLNTTDFCVAYENGTPEENTFDPSCFIPVNEYFWLNSLHPTYPMHDVLAQQLALLLEAGPNIC